MGLIAPILALLVVVGIFAFAILAIVRNILYVCEPSEVLVFSGRTRQRSDGKEVGYRYVKGGRAYRVPLIETVDRMDLTNMIIDLQVKGAYSRNGIPLTVHGVANIKVPGEEPLIHNALERFLGKSRAEIMDIGRETLEGNLRGVLAALTPEQVNQDKEAFAARLTEEAEHDLSHLGLVLDTLKIQNVTDEAGYLDAIGRMASADIRKHAVVAEANAKADAAQQKWRNTMEAEVQKLDTQVKVATAENSRRVAEARSKRGAVIAEQKAEVVALIAQTQAEIQMQDARLEQVKLRLDADVIQPAEAARQQAVQQAKADAAKIIEQGNATATVLKNLAATYRGSGTSARDVLLMQKLVPMLQRITESMGSVKIDRLTVIGKTTGANGGNLAGQLVTTSEQIKAATGIDVPQIIKDRYGSPAPSGAGPQPRSVSVGPAVQPSRPQSQPPRGLPPGVRGE
jgi:flotillin